MTLDQFRRAVEIARLANVPVTLTLEQAQWLLEGVELSKKALIDVEWIFDYDKQNSQCPWCKFRSKWQGFELGEVGEHSPGCMRQLALKHWKGEP